MAVRPSTFRPPGSRPSARQRGYTARWEKLRRRHLAEFPLCRMCEERDGRVTVATVVDHVVPHRGDYALLFDPGNLQSLCTSHHSRDKQREERGGRPRPVTGADGWPVEV